MDICHALLIPYALISTYKILVLFTLLENQEFYDANRIK